MVDSSDLEATLRKSRDIKYWLQLVPQTLTREIQMIFFLNSNLVKIETTYQMC